MTMVVKGYRVIALPLNRKTNAFHDIYLKEHVDRSNKNAAGRTLFVGNVYYLLNMTHHDIDRYLRVLLERFGDIESISVSSFTAEDLENTRFAHVLFNKKSALKLAINATEEDYALAVKEASNSVVSTTSNKVKSAQDIKKMFAWFDIDASELQREVDEYMQRFEKEESLAESERKKLLNVPDNEGFITVTR